MLPQTPPAGSTGGSPQTPAQFQTPPDSTGGSPQTLKPRMVQLVDWCLEKVEGEEGKIRVFGTTWTPQMRDSGFQIYSTANATVLVKRKRKGASSSQGVRRVAGRVFRSSAIAKRLSYNTMESEDGFLIRIVQPLNIPETMENGFSLEVCNSFLHGIPTEWQSLVNPKMVPFTPSASKHSVEYYVEKHMDVLRTDVVEKHMDVLRTDNIDSQWLSNFEAKVKEELKKLKDTKEDDEYSM